MISKLVERINDAEDIIDYGQATQDLIDHLIAHGKKKEAETIAGIAKIRKNRFSSRETIDEMNKKKSQIINYCRFFLNDEKYDRDMILSVLYWNDQISGTDIYNRSAYNSRQTMQNSTYLCVQV